VIVLAWVNDEDTKRAYEGGDDAYRVFRKMLASGHPPDDWDQLLKEAKPAAEQLQSSMAAPAGLNVEHQPAYDSPQVRKFVFAAITAMLADRFDAERE
jgi:hypothetical protein